MFHFVCPYSLGPPCYMSASLLFCDLASDSGWDWDFYFFFPNSQVLLINLMDLLVKEEPPPPCVDPGWIWCHQQVKTLLFLFSLCCVRCQRNPAYFQARVDPWFPLVCVEMFRLEVEFSLVMTFVLKFRIFGCLPRRGRHCPVWACCYETVWMNEIIIFLGGTLISQQWLMGLSRSRFIAVSNSVKLGSCILYMFNIH